MSLKEKFGDLPLFNFMENLVQATPLIQDVAAKLGGSLHDMLGLAMEESHCRHESAADSPEM